jgi:quercetin dioxygenase-like cupin family protein
MGTVHKQSSATASAHWSYPDVPLADYRTDASPGIMKQVLVGLAEGASDFIVRYFTIPPGGGSALDRHRHQHGVVITHGHGRVLIGTEWHDLGPGDAVFTDSDEIHRFEAGPTDSLGFICVIPRWAEDDTCALPAR